jgi:hypothetical protein
MNSNERRRDARVNIRVPFQFRILNTSNSPEQLGESKNISRRGIYFETTVPLKVGTPLEVSLRMPRELSGKSLSDVKCVARVIHIRNAQGKGKTGVGLHIERYEAKISERERWAS